MAGAPANTSGHTFIVSTTSVSSTPPARAPRSLPNCLVIASTGNRVKRKRIGVAICCMAVRKSTGRSCARSLAPSSPNTTTAPHPPPSSGANHFFGARMPSTSVGRNSSQGLSTPEESAIGAPSPKMNPAESPKDTAVVALRVVRPWTKSSMKGRTPSLKTASARCERNAVSAHRATTVSCCASGKSRPVFAAKTVLLTGSLLCALAGHRVARPSQAGGTGPVAGPARSDAVRYGRQWLRPAWVRPRRSGPRRSRTPSCPGPARH